ncbi:MAG: 2-iminoacetate synthase ThiH [Deltaproteobacteria bacterium]|nr:2-iminoacetate synthase ThiH [Deltaproteobacteria bacterium]
MSFYDEIKEYEWDAIQKSIQNSTREDVEKSLAARTLGLEDLIHLLSPAAESFLEEIAQRSHRLTEQRFGKVIHLFAPLYVSNFCTNRCVYCGFNAGNSIERLALTVDEAVEEARVIRDLGFRNILLVSGEAPQIVPTEYFSQLVQRLRPLFPSISIEIYPMPTEDYQALIESGVDGLVVFQETYNEKLYGTFHPSGKKSNYRWRLETPDRGGEAGFRRIGLGALLGLTDWRTETFFLALHGRYLLRRFWKSHVSISFPRLRPAAGAFEPSYPVSDLEMVQMLTVLRLFLPDAGLVLSTRETAFFRDNLIPLGVTSMSAGSRTEPGGYTRAEQAEAQFKISDERPPEVVVEVIRQKGYDPVWKDWDAAFLSS